MPVCACVRACVCACVRVCQCVRETYSVCVLQSISINKMFVFPKGFITCIPRRTEWRTPLSLGNCRCCCGFFSLFPIV